MALHPGSHEVGQLAGGGQSPEQSNTNKQGWLAHFQTPQGRAQLIQFGINMLTPTGFSDPSVIQSFGPALGAAFQAGGRVDANQAGTAQQAFENRQVLAKGERQEEQFGVEQETARRGQDVDLRRTQTTAGATVQSAGIGAEARVEAARIREASAQRLSERAARVGFARDLAEQAADLFETLVENALESRLDPDIPLSNEQLDRMADIAISRTEESGAAFGLGGSRRGSQELPPDGTIISQGGRNFIIRGGAPVPLDSSDLTQE